jgi:hypothetical protein
MTIRIAVPLRDRCSGYEGGVSLTVAAAKLRVFEFHEGAMRAKSNEISFDARYDECEVVIDRYLLVRGTDGIEGSQLFLAGDTDTSIEFFKDVKESIGHFAADVQLFSQRPEALHASDEFTTDAMDEFADEAGFQLPTDWEYRFKMLQKKHLPPPVIGDYVPERRAVPTMPIEYEIPVATKRCACGNYASGPGGLCNSCKRGRAIAAAEELAHRLSAETAKRARVSDETSPREEMSV